jgi:beta-galactosidase/beta-glucuronidase
MQNNWQPVQGNLLTRWTKDVNPECPRPEYPRPQMTRERWLNLNGLWDYSVVDQSVERIERFYQKILVPFPLESALSGVKQPLRLDQRLWYRRTFRVPEEWKGERVLLHFGAVDWQAEVWVNGKKAGSHLGGYLPFSFDITPYLWEDDNVILMAVWDPSEAGLQECGKQTRTPNGIWYTSISGIWQTVWLEPVPQTYIQSIKMTPDIDTGKLTLDVVLGGETKGTLIHARAFAGGQEIATAEGMTWIPFHLQIPNPHLWSVDDPYLYDLKITLLKDGQPVDEVGSYFGMRQFSIEKDKNGRPRTCLNHKPVFMLGPLDQGYWPDGLYTAPTEEAMLFDLEYTKKLGLNTVRKHVKVEPLRWYYACDKLGLIVWQDMPNGGKPVGDTTSTLAMHFGLNRDDTRDYKSAGRTEEANRKQYREDLKGMIDLLYNSPCIGLWVPFNEGWGQFDAREVGEWTKQYDPTRLVDHASGWYDRGGPDFISKHAYVLKLKNHSDRSGRPYIISEFGGYSWMVPGHSWNEAKKFGYKFYDSSAALTTAYVDLLEKELLPLIDQGLCAAIYTETTDAEIEINGYLTYDREVEKMDLQRVRDLHRRLIGKL